MAKNRQEFNASWRAEAQQTLKDAGYKESENVKAFKQYNQSKVEHFKTAHDFYKPYLNARNLAHKYDQLNQRTQSVVDKYTKTTHGPRGEAQRSAKWAARQAEDAAGIAGRTTTADTMSTKPRASVPRGGDARGGRKSETATNTSGVGLWGLTGASTTTKPSAEEAAPEEVAAEKKKPKEEKKDSLKNIYNDAQNYLMLLDTMDLPAEDRAALRDAFSGLCADLEKERAVLLDEADYFRSEEARAAYAQKYDARVRENVKMSDREYEKKKAREEKYSAYTKTADELYLANPQEAVDYLGGMLAQKEAELEAANAEVAAAQKLDADSPSGNNNSALMLATRKQSQLAEEVQQLEWATSTYESKRLYDTGKLTWEPKWNKLDLTGRREQLTSLNSKILEAQATGDAGALRSLQEEWDWYATFGGEDAAVIIRQLTYENNLAEIERLDANIASLENILGQKLAAGGEQADTATPLISTRIADLKYRRGQLEQANTIYLRTEYENDSRYALRYNDDFEVVSSGGNFVNPSIDELAAYGRAKAYSDAEIGAILTNGGSYGKDGNLYDAAGNLVASTTVDPKTGAISHSSDPNAPIITDKLGLFLSERDETTGRMIVDEEQLEKAQQIVANGESNLWADFMVESDAKSWSELTESEIATYYYIYRKESREAAYEYLDALTPLLNKRETEKHLGRVYESKGFERLYYNVASVPQNILGGVAAFAEDTIRMASGNDVNPYSRLHLAQTIAQATRQTTGEIIDNFTAGQPLTRDELTQLWKGEYDGVLPEGTRNRVLGISLGDAYQAGMSGLDSMFGAFVLGAGAYGTLMGMGAASTTAKNYYEKGASRDQILTMSLVAGTAEMLFEKWSVEQLLKRSASDGLVKNFLRQGLAEGSEEINTEIANIITDALVMGEQSDWTTAIHRYGMEGYTPAQASAMALMDIVEQTWKAGVSGFLSGGMSSSVYTIAQQLDNKRQQHDLNVAWFCPPDTTANQLAQEIFKQRNNIALRLSAGESIGPGEYSSLQAKQIELAKAIKNLDSDVKADAEAEALKFEESQTAEEKKAVLRGQGAARLAEEAANRGLDLEAVSAEEADVAIAAEAEAAQPAATAEAPTHTGPIAAAVESAKVNKTGKPVGDLVTAIMHDPASMAELNIPVTGPTNTQKRTAIIAKVKDIIAQESLDTNSAAADNKSNTAPAPREKAPERATVSDEGIPQYEEFSSTLRERSPKYAALSDQEMQVAYNAFVEAERAKRREAAAEKEAVEATAGKWVFIEETGEWLSYSRFADAVRRQLSKSGKTLDAKSARGTFEVAYASQAELRASNLKEVEAAANSINAAFKTAGVKLGVRVSSGKGEFSYRKGITEGAFYDPKTHEIVFNGDAIHAADMLYYVLAHEVIHPAAKADPAIVKSVLDTFQQLRDKGYKFNAKTARILADLDTEMAVLLDRYQRHAGARKKITREYVEEELAGNLLREVYAELDLMKEFAKVDAAPLRKSHEWVKRIRNTLSGKKSKTAAEDNAAFKDILDTLNRNLTEALKKADTLREKAENGTLSTADAKGGNYNVTDEVKAAMSQETQEAKDSSELSYMLTELDATVNTPWWQQVDNRLVSNPRNALYLPETFNILAEVGLPDLPLCMTAKHLNDAMHEESANNPAWHGISEDIMKKLPELLAKPVMVLDSWTTPGDIVVVTSAIDHENRPVVVPIHPNGEAVVGGVKGPANFITTAYGRANFAPKPMQTSAYNFMYLALRNRAILYWNKERSETLRQALGVQFPLGLSKVRSDEIIREYRGYVKGQAPQRRFMLSEEVEYGEDSSELFPTDVHGRGRLAGLDAQSRGAQVYGLDGRTRQEENRGRVPASDRTAGSRNSAGTSSVAAGAAEFGQNVSRTAQRDDGSQTTYGQADTAYRGRTNSVLRPDGAEAYAPRGGVQSNASEDGRRSETPTRDRMARVHQEESTRKTGDRTESPATRTAGARSVVLRDLGASSEVEAQEDPFDFESLNDKIQTWSDAGSYVKDNIRSDDIVFDVEPDYLPPWETEVTLIVYQQTGPKDIVYSRDAAGLRKLRRDLPKLMAKAGYLDGKVWRDGNPQSTEITDDLKTEVHDLLPAGETGSAIWEAEQKELDRVGFTLYATRNEVLFEHAIGLTQIAKKRVIAGYGRAVLQHERLHAYMETDKKLYFQIRDAVTRDKKLARVLETAREVVRDTWGYEHATPLEELHRTEMEVFAEAFANNVALLGRNIRQLAPIVRREVARWTRAWDADTRSVQEKKYAPDISELQEEYGKRGVDTSEDEALFAGIEDGLYYSLEEDYDNALAQNDLGAAQQAVIEYAASKGYDTLGFHGTDSAGFTVVANGYWLWFARDNKVAREYGNYFPGKNVNLKAPHDINGVYSMAYRLGNNLRIDADGYSWAELPVNPYDYPGVYMDDETGEVSTNALAEWAAENGYDSITFENVDDGGLTTVDVIFNPRRDAKSVDPITYDDNGNVIPLPERFDETNNDLRYSLDDVYGGVDELIDRAFAYKWVDLNRAYFDAAQNGNTERARSLLDMAAARLGYPVRDGDFYKRDPAHREALAAYGPQQISAELIVWDEDGDVSPPGVRYKEVEIALDRIFNAGASAIDRAYFDALDRDDALFVQVLVDKAARRAGFVTPLYHGTDAEFNVFRRGEIGIHAGTWAQARDRLLDTDRIFNPKSRILRLYAHTGPSLPTSDIGYWSGSELASTMLRTGDYHWLVLGANATREEIIDKLEEIADTPGVESDAAIRQLLRDTGWNCIKYDNTVEGVHANGGVAGNTSYIIFDPNEVKSAEPVTYDGDGIIPLSERFNLQSGDLRYALDEDDASPGQDDGVFSLFANAYKAYTETAKKEHQNVVTAADIGSTAQKDAPIGVALYSSNPAITEEDFFEMAQVFQQLMDTYGVINKPAGAVRKDSAPRRTAPENKVSETVATVLGAAATPDGRVPTIMQMVVEDKVSYSPKTNAASIRAARGKLTQMGFQNARVDWSTRVHNNETSAEMVAMGAILLNNAGNSNATGEEYVSILMDYAYLLRNSSQATQAAQILKRLTPEGKLYAVQKTVDKINDQQKKRRRPGKKTRRGKADPKNGRGRTRRDGTGKKSGDIDHGLPVDEWMDKVGEELAKSITNKLSASPEKAKTVSQTILGDLKKFAEQTLPTQNKKMAKRTSMDRLRDLFENKDHYEKAWAMAKKKMREEFGASKETMDAINEWMNQSLDFAALLTEELTDYQDVRVDPRLAEAYLKAETDRQRDEILELICKNIAAQIKATGAEKFNALRYTAMLGNLKTQVRNMAGNIAMQPVRIASTSVQGILEALLQLTGVRIERTTSVLHDWGTFKYARQEYEKVRHAILGGKHTVEINDEIRSMIEENRSIWKFNVRGVNIHPLELWRLATDKMMNGGDALFCSFTFADALSRYMKANRTTWAKASDELKDRAREYAIREAAEATFRDNNQFAIMIARAARAKDATTAERVKAAVAEGTQPFRKTPANVLVRALEYSPVGLVYTTVNALRVARGSENVTGTDIIRSLSKTLTGSGLVYLGAALAALGLLRGRAPEEEDEAAFEEMLGHQEYSIELDGKSYTLDWLAPVCIPVFLGANLQQMALENGLTLSEFGKAMSGLTDPILKMSMLQGVNDTLENAATYGDDSALTRFTGNALWGFVTQAVPTLLGQAERASTNTRMMTYVDKNNEAIPDGIQRLLGKLSAKIPGWDYAQFVYTDAWGRMEQNAETETWNVISQFLSPGYASTIEDTAMEKELLRLYRATGDSSVLIQNASKYFTVDGVRKDLTGDEYVSFNTTRGQTAFAVMTALVASEAYKQMDDKSKAKAVASVYNFATQSAKLELTNGEYAADSWVVKAIDAAYEVGLPVQTVVTYKTALSVLEDTFPDGVNYEGEDMAVKTFVGMQIAQDSSLNDEQRNALGPILIAGGRWIPDDTVTDYSNIDSYKMSQQSASAQTKFEHLPSQFSMDVDMFADAYEICNQKGVSAPAKKTQLAELLGNEEDANDFYAYIQRETITEDKVSHLPENVGAELVRLSQSDVGYNYTIAPPDSTPAASYKDPSSKSGRSAATREWVLTAEQYDEYISMRDELYISKMEALLRSSAYKTASDSKKCELIVELKEEVSDEHYDNFIDWLSRNAKSTPVK